MLRSKPHPLSLIFKTYPESDLFSTAPSYLKMPSFLSSGLLQKPLKCFPWLCAWCPYSSLHTNVEVTGKADVSLVLKNPLVAFDFIQSKRQILTTAPGTSLTSIPPTLFNSVHPLGSPYYSSNKHINKKKLSIIYPSHLTRWSATGNLLLSDIYLGWRQRRKREKRSDIILF